MNKSAAEFAADVDEFESVGLDKEYGRVNTMVPLVKQSPVKFECVLHAIFKIPGNLEEGMGNASVVIGRVVAVHVEE